MATDNRATPQNRASSRHAPEGPIDVPEALRRLMKIEGAVGAAVVDYESGETLGHDSSRALDMEQAGADGAAVLRAKRNVVFDLRVGEPVRDILVSLETQYHLIRTTEWHEDIFIYVVIDRNRGNLGLARRKIDGIQSTLKLE